VLTEKLDNPMSLKQTLSKITGKDVVWIEVTPDLVIVHHDAERYLGYVSKFTYKELKERHDITIKYRDLK